MLCFLHKVFSEAVQFAPLGLINMFNSGGALDDVSSTADSSATTIHVRCRGPGRFGAYSATRPELCRVDGQQVEFSHTEDGLLAFDLPHCSSHDGDLWRIEILYRSPWIRLPSQHARIFRGSFQRSHCSEKVFREAIVQLVLMVLHSAMAVLCVILFTMWLLCCTGITVILV